MALADLFRDTVVPILSNVFDSMKSTVTYEAWSSQTGKGVDSYPTSVTKQALVERMSKQKYTRSGKLLTIVAKLTFLEPFAMDPRDRITLADGTTGELVIDGFEDPATGARFVNEVELGVVTHQVE